MVAPSGGQSTSFRGVAEGRVPVIVGQQIQVLDFAESLVGNVGYQPTSDPLSVSRLCREGDLNFEPLNKHEEKRAATSDRLCSRESIPRQLLQPTSV